MLTLKKVKELVEAPSHAKRTPSPKMLFEEGIVLLRREFDQGSHLTVYNSGYVLFSAGKRNTVFHIHGCCGDYAYDAAEGKGDVIEEEYFESCEWHIRALFEGERKMEDNQAKCEDWEQMRENNYGLLLWGKVGTGKSYFAGCIANALMEQEISVRMTNFSAILNDLTASFEGRNEYIERLCRFPLLILDDFGMERGTEYGLEQVYNVIDSRYRSRKPLIVTTNLSLTELQNPQDTAHARIYDRVLEMCLPILFTGENFRKETAQAKLNGLKELLK